ncbi:hypothetical protein PG991_001209 [Apiospora marii]|uniref:Zinc-binding loop region of homing endonuclease domain-containing protein n=1 Tax=Apiospora marii TaxID=335849 RepID=A0ABR1SWF0_9PEZI
MATATTAMDMEHHMRPGHRLLRDYRHVLLAQRNHGHGVPTLTATAVRIQDYRHGVPIPTTAAAARTQDHGLSSRGSHTHHGGGGGGPHPEPLSRVVARAPPKSHAPDTSIDAFASIDKHTGLWQEHRAKLAEHTAALAGDLVPDVLRESLDRKIRGVQRAMDQFETQLVGKLHKKLKFEKEGIKFERVTPVLALHIYDLSTKLSPEDKHLTDAHVAKLAEARAPGGELHVAEAPNRPVVPKSPASPVRAPPRPPAPHRSPALSRSPPKSRQTGDLATDSEPEPEPDDDKDEPIHGPENRSKQTRCQRGYRHQADCIWDDLQKEHRVTKDIVESYSSDACSTCITFLPFTLYAWPIHPGLQLVSGLRNQRKRWQRSYGCKHCRKTFPYFHAIRFQLKAQVREYIDSQQLPEANWITFSHLCGNKWCFKIEHVHLEPLDVNQGREDSRTGTFGRVHMWRLSPCAVDECNMEFDAAFVLEWLNVNAGLTLPLKKDYIAPALVGRGLQHGDYNWLMHEHGDMFLQDCRYVNALSRDQMNFKYYSAGEWYDLKLPPMWRDNLKTAWLFHHEVESLATYSRAPKMSDLDGLLARVTDFMTHAQGIPLDLSPWRAFTGRPSGDRNSLQVVRDKSVGYRYELCHIGFYQCRSTTERDQTNPSKRPYSSLRSIIEHVYLKHREVPRCLRAAWLGKEIKAIEGLWDELVDMFPKVADDEVPGQLVQELVTGTFAPEIRVIAGDANRDMNE